MKIPHFILIILLLAALFVTACQPENRVAHEQPVGATAVGVDAPSLPPTLSFLPAPSTVGDREVMTQDIAWQAGYPLTSFDPQTRARVDLAGTWRKERVRVDSDLTLSGRGTVGLAAIEAEANGRYQSDFDDSAWAEKELPGVENTMTATGPEKVEGGIWYRRNFTVPAEWEGQRVTFNALAMNYVADVWINGQWLGYHEGGYTPFALDAAPVLTYGGENSIAIRIDNPAWDSRNDIVPGVKPDWWNYAGVVQDLYLEAAPPLWIVRADVQTPDLSGQVPATIVLHNAGSETQKGTLTVQIRETDTISEGWLTDPQPSAIAAEPVGEPFTLGVELEPGQALVVPVTELQIPDPQLWSPENPALYVLEATLEAGEQTDTFMSQFGVRTITTDGHQLRLNGEPYFLAGIARHEDWPDSGRTATWDKIRKDFEIIQEYNANFVRTGHYPNHPYTYLLMDRMGLLAAEEIPVWQYDADAFNAQAERQIADQMWREMILAGSNRPSIILWSMHNESQDIPERADYIERLTADYDAHLQDGRLLTQSAAADRGGPADSTQALVDVAGWTMYFGVFYGDRDYAVGTTAFLEQAHEAYPDKPLLNTEYGIWSKGGGSSIYRQVDLFESMFPALTAVTTWDENGAYNPDGYLSGITWWAMFDWYTAHTYVQTMGLMGMDRETAKPVAAELQAAYAPWQTQFEKQ
ncbi:MAG: glycoside hydrolase family 2 TIM barrel-domain containing protein [Chloroflexota bacterium]